MTNLATLPDHVTNPDPGVYASGNYVALDFETTGYSKGMPQDERNRLLLACWKLGPQHPLVGRGPEVKACWGTEFQQAELLADIALADFVVSHNAKFELGWLLRCGLDLHDVLVWDTMIADYVRGGNKYQLTHLSLNNCLARWGLEGKADLVGKLIKKGMPVELIPSYWVEEYCVRDVEAAEELYLAQYEDMSKSSLMPIMYQRCLVTPALADIEMQGMFLDADEVFRLEEEYEREYANLTDQLQTFMEGASPSSNPQKCTFIYDTLGFEVPTDYRGAPILTDSGSPSVKADVIAQLKPRTARQREFIELHGKWTVLNSHLTKYIRKFADCCRDDGGYLRAAFNQTNTRSQRLSSSGVTHRVQFQNFNRDFKPLFRARHDGWVIGEADGAQLEFRVAAHMGRDSVALRDIATGTDIHSITASVIGVDRTTAKAFTFKPLYGGSSGTKAQQRYYSTFKERYSGVADTQAQWLKDTVRTKRLTTEWGLTYYFPGCKVKPSGYVTHTSNVYNYPVQAFATAEIIPCALVCAWHRMKNLRSFLVNTVHDSIIAELHPDEVDTWHVVAKQCLVDDCYMMISRLYGIDLTVPLAAGVTVDTHWGTKKAKEGEVTHEAERELWVEAAFKEGMIDEEVRRNGFQVPTAEGVSA